MANENIDTTEVDNEIARILSEYEKTLTFNNTLLLMNTIKIPNSSYVIECGLCPTRNFSPALILKQHDFEMIFSTSEWSKLIEELHKIYTNTEEIDLRSTISIGDFTTIRKMLQGNVTELILMQRLTSLYLSDSDISELLKINIALLSHRVAMLGTLNFSYYYHNVLYSLKECFNYNSSSNPNMSIVEILNVFCESTDNSLLSNALREYIYFYKEDIM